MAKSIHDYRQFLPGGGFEFAKGFSAKMVLILKSAIDLLSFTANMTIYSEVLRSEMKYIVHV